MTEPVAHFDAGGAKKKKRSKTGKTREDILAEDGTSRVNKPEVQTARPKLAYLDMPGVIRTKLPLWEEKWNETALRKQRGDMSARDFDRGFRQIAISEEDLFFPGAAIDASLDTNFCAAPYLAPDSKWLKLPRYTGIDLAIADAEAGGSYFVITVIAVDKNLERWILWIERTRGISFDSQIQVIEDVHERFLPVIHKIENNGYQDAVVQNSRKKGLPVEAYTTSSISKRDLEIGLPSLGVEFEQGRWHIPNGDARSKRVMEPLEKELRVYPLAGYHDDCVMSLFFAQQAVRQAPTVEPRIHILRMGR